ncbi:DEAD/DEAH box helicase [Salisediminibacterium selenitireducens]|nr:DEAD/DEAH box helicase [Salisediminibacterium selenitireducens]
MKQALYDHDRSSGYGLAFSLKTVKHASDSCRAVPVSLTAAEHLLGDKENHFPTEDPWIQYIKELLAVPLLPAPDGSWFFQFIPLAVPTEIHVVNDATLTSYRSEEVDWQRWLISFLTCTSPFKTKKQKLINDLKLYANYEEISEWASQIHKDSAITAPLPSPYYQLAIQVMNNDWCTETFQMELILHEPDSNRSEWLLTAHVRELGQNKRVPYEEIIMGNHPFSSNPYPSAKQLFTRILGLFSANEIPVQASEGQLELSEDSMALFVSDIVPLCKDMGINCWLPSSLKQEPDLAIRMQLNEEVEETFSKGPWITSDISWTLKLNDEEMEQQLFRQLVEEERRVIHFHDRWYLWNQEEATRLLNEADQTKPKTLFFQGLREQAIEPQHHGDSPKGREPSRQIDVNRILDSMRTHHKPEVLEPWNSRLRYYQQEGLSWLLGMRRLGIGAILADDMGLGKSRQIMAYIDHLIGDLKTSRFLIVCPSSLLHHWDQELAQYFSDDWIHIHEGTVAHRRDQFQSSKTRDHCIHVISYATLVRDQALFEQVKWSAMIIDEAQKIKNPRTQQRKTAAKMEAAHTIALTGTPVENHPEELISLSELINPGYLLDTAEPEYDRDLKPDLIKQLIRPMMLRRTKEEVQEDLKLPDKTHHHHKLTLSFEQETMYKAVVEEMFDQYEEAPDPVKRAALFKTMMKLKQLCNHPAQARKELGLNRFNPGRSPKWDLANELLSNWANQGKRAIVFTQFRYTGAMFQEMQLIQGNPPVPFLHGGLTAIQRKNMIRSFKDNPDIPFMIISLRAGGFGLNLTEASAVLHFDRWWNPAVEDQATDRVHRIGQKQAVEVHTLMAEGTIEERIDDLIQKKQQLQEALIDGRPLPLWTLSESELRELFSLQP